MGALDACQGQRERPRHSARGLTVWPYTVPLQEDGAVVAVTSPAPRVQRGGAGRLPGAKRTPQA